MNLPSDCPVAFAHHWLISMRGGEKALEAILDLFPHHAPIHTLVLNRSKVSAKILQHPILPSPMQFVPFAQRHHRKMVPLFPWAIRNMRFSGKHRLLISTDSAMIKGVSVPRNVKHVCYCYSPPRYLWDLWQTYTEPLHPLAREAFRWCVPYLRKFDVEAAQRVDHFVTISRFTQDYLRKVYNRESELIYPPVEVEKFDPTQPSEDYDLIVGELTHGKRIDLAVEAYAKTGRKLIVIGEGEAMPLCQSKAGSTVSLLGRVAEIKPYVERCRAFIFPQIEAFGIAAVEALAAGKPVLALCAGGALDIIEDGKSGLFFDEQSVESLIDCLERFEEVNRGREWRTDCRARAEMFSTESFQKQFRAFLEKKSLWQFE